MDKKLNTEVSLINIDLSLNNITRCPDCNLISSLKLNYKEGKPIINYYCENYHNGNMNIYKNIIIILF